MHPRELGDLSFLVFYGARDWIVPGKDLQSFEIGLCGLNGVPLPD